MNQDDGIQAEGSPVRIAGVLWSHSSPPMYQKL